MNQLLKVLLLAPLRLSRIVIANSQITAKWLRPTVGSVIVRNAASVPDKVTPVSFVQKADFQVCTVGRLNARKRHETVIRAVARIRDSGVDVSLTVIGGPYPGYEFEQERLTALIEDLGVSSHVHLVGEREDAPSWMTAADIVAVPSEVESFGLVAAEAQRLGTAVVVSDIPALNEIVTHGATGWIVPVGDVVGWAEAISAALLDEHGRREVVHAAKMHADFHFSESAYNENLSAAIDLVESPA